MSDISETLLAKSDQINADDLIGTTVTITVQEVEVKGGDQQPVDIHTRETPGKAYRPSKSMRRVLAHGWGTDSSQWVGRAMTLFRNPEIKFGKEKVGGIEISHMSHLDKPLVVPLTRGKGRKQPFTVQPLQVPPQQQGPDIDAYIVQAAGDPEKLQKLWHWAKDRGEPEAVLDRIAASQQPPQGEQQ